MERETEREAMTRTEIDARKRHTCRIKRLPIVVRKGSSPTTDLYFMPQPGDIETGPLLGKRAGFGCFV
jgi:hypothetical protein